MLVGLGRLGEDLGYLGFVQRGSEGLEQGLVPLLLLHLQGSVQQLAVFQVIDHQVEQVDVLDPQARLVLGDVLQQEADVLPNAKFLLGRVVEDEEGDLVAEALARQEIIGRDPGKDLVQSVAEGIAHGATWMQRRTYCSSCFSR